MGFLARTDDGEVSEKVIEYFHQRFQEEVKLESFNLKDIKIDPQRGFENLLDLRQMNIGLEGAVGRVPHSARLGASRADDPAPHRRLHAARSRDEPDGGDPAVLAGVRARQRATGHKIAIEAVKDMALQAVTLPDDSENI